MPEEYVLPWRSRGRSPGRRKEAEQVEVHLPGCSTNVWGKPDLRIICETCEEMFVCEEADADR